MFGWEFPPYVTGGLGVACYNLVKALSDLGHQITLILPKSLNNSQEEIEKGFTVFGTDSWEFYLQEQMHKQLANSPDPSIETLKIPSRLTAYAGASSPVDMSVLSRDALQKIYSLKTSQSYVTDEQAAQKTNLYGKDLIQEVMKYNATAASIAATLDFDLIHCHDWLTFGAGIIAKQVSNKPMIAHVHCTEFDRCPGQGNEQVHSLEKAGCDYADRVISVSHFTKKLITTNYQIPPEKVEVVHNGIDSDCSSFPTAKNFNTHSPKILFLGRVTYQKGPNYFLEAAHKVLKVRPDAQFIMVGTGDMLDYLRARAQELGIADKVEFRGAISSDKVQQMYREVDCFVLSSVSEPFGLTVLEALSQRLPVIASKQAGVSEVLRHILRYDFWDVERLSSLILSVITYGALAQELKERSLEDLHSLSWAESAKKIEQVYQ